MSEKLRPWELDQHLAAIEFMKNLPDKIKPPRPQYTPPISKARRVMQSWRMPVIRCMKIR